MARIANKPVETDNAMLPDGAMPAEQAGEAANSDLAVKAPETAKVPETAKQRPLRENKQAIKPVTKPANKIHIDEFLLTSGLRPEQRAGFRAYASAAYNSEDGWKKSLGEYQNREYRKEASK